jgi:pullulanase/glycogen debranching enzyme
MMWSYVNDNGTFNSNSYNAGDEVNSIKWDTLSDKKYADVFEYYKGLIKFIKVKVLKRCIFFLLQTLTRQKLQFRKENGRY